MEFTIHDILEQFGLLVNKAQKIRNDIPIDMKRGDARHVCLSGIQTTLRPLMLSYGALECTNQTILNVDLTKVCGIKNSSNEQILAEFDTWAKLNLLVFTHFRLETLFSNLLGSIDFTQRDKRGFDKITTSLFALITIADKSEKIDCLKIFSLLRNSLHNNSINKNPDFQKAIKGKTFSFTKGLHTSASIFDIIILIDSSLDIIEEVIKSPEVLNLPAPIEDLFHIQLGYT